MLKLSYVYIYTCDGPPYYNIEEISVYLSKLFPKVKIKERGDFFSYWEREASGIDNLARAISCCRVHNVNEEIKEFSPFPLEIDYEKKRLKKEKKLKGIVYDGFRLQSVYEGLIESKELSLLSCHIILTDQLLGTFGENDKRYHLRVGIYGSPNIISTSGFIEALAKPKEYYLKLQMGIDPAVLKEEFKQDIIDYEDKRITELLKGSFLQAIFYHTCGEPFCEDKNCRLYNAHWQKDALRAQIESKKEFCLRHAKIIAPMEKVNGKKDKK